MRRRLPKALRVAAVAAGALAAAGAFDFLTTLIQGSIPPIF